MDKPTAGNKGVQEKGQDSSNKNQHFGKVQPLQDAVEGEDFVVGVHFVKLRTAQGVGVANLQFMSQPYTRKTIIKYW